MTEAINAQPEAVLQKLRRVLKPGGLLSFSDHHLSDEEIRSKLTAGGLFSFSGKGRRTYAFVAVCASGGGSGTAQMPPVTQSR